MKPYERLSDRPYDSHYLHIETVIDHPVAEVWPHVLDIGAWMSAHQLDTLDGAPGAVGYFERVSPRGVDEASPKPHHHLYGIAEVIPHKLVALEVLPEFGGSYGSTRDWMSFDAILLTDLGTRTHLLFYMVDVTMGKGDEAFHVAEKAKLDAGRELIEQYFDNLKRNIRNAQ